MLKPSLNHFSAISVDRLGTLSKRQHYWR